MCDVRTKSSCYAAPVSFYHDTRIMLSKLLRSIVIGLIVAGLLLLAMPSLRQFNKLPLPSSTARMKRPQPITPPFAAPPLPWLTFITAP